jgi:hypothetical protein
MLHVSFSLKDSTLIEKLHIHMVLKATRGAAGLDQAVVGDGQNRGVSIALPSGTHFRDLMYHKITANQISWNQESGNLDC